MHARRQRGAMASLCHRCRICDAVGAVNVLRAVSSRHRPLGLREDDMRKTTILLCAIVAPALAACSTDQSTHADVIGGLILGLSVGEESHTKLKPSHHAQAPKQAHEAE